MRKVKFRKWIKKEGDSGYSYTEFEFNGLFHQWGNNLAETSEQIASYTMGIIELPDGVIILVAPENIKFINRVPIQ
jgi:hypothetical protein